MASFVQKRDREGRGSIAYATQSARIDSDHFTKVPLCWGVWIAICFLVDTHFLPNSLKENILAYKAWLVNGQSSVLKTMDKRPCS